MLHFIISSLPISSSEVSVSENAFANADHYALMIRRVRSEWYPSFHKLNSLVAHYATYRIPINVLLSFTKLRIVFGRPDKDEFELA
jgi:hypothetical protein